jgi:hypothetical protein
MVSEKPVKTSTGPAIFGRAFPCIEFAWYVSESSGAWYEAFVSESMFSIFNDGMWARQSAAGRNRTGTEYFSS